MAQGLFRVDLLLVRWGAAVLVPAATKASGGTTHTLLACRAHVFNLVIGCVYSVFYRTNFVIHS